MDVLDGTSRLRSSSSSTALAAAAAMTSTTNSLTSRLSSSSSSAAPQEKLSITLGADIDLEVAKESTTIKYMIEDIGDKDKTMHLDCTQRAFGLLKPLMELQYNYKKESLRKEHFIKKVLKTKTTDELMQIVLVANYLDVQPALEFVSEKLAKRFGKKNNLYANLACPTFPALNTHRDVTSLLCNCFWREGYFGSRSIEALRFWVNQDQRDNYVPKVFSFSWLNGKDYSIGWNRDGSMIAAVSNNGRLEIWDVFKDVCIKTILGGTQSFYQLRWNRDCSMIAAVSNRQIKIWDVHKGVCIKTVPCNIGKLRSQWAWSPDGSRIAVFVADEKKIEIWDVFDGVFIKEALLFCVGTIGSLCWSPDGTMIAFGLESPIGIDIWDVHKGIRTKRLFVHGEVKRLLVSWSPDGIMIAYASTEIDKAIRIWNVTSGNCLQTLRETNTAFSVCWSPDGSRIASGLGLLDSTIKIWDLNIPLLKYMQNSLTIAQALLLLKAHQCKKENVPLDLTNQYLCQAYRTLPDDLKELLERSLKNASSLHYARIEPVD